MQTVRLKVKGGMFSLGLIAEDMRNWLDPASSGDIVAHDALEHCNGYKAIGSVHDELQALGAITFVRAGQYPPITLGREAARQVAHTLENRRLGFQKRAVWRPVVDAERETACANDAELISIVVHARTAESKHVATLAERGDDILHYLRMGWRKTQERFGTPTAAREQFNAIHNAVDPWTWDLRLGEKYDLTWGDGKATCVRVGEAQRQGPVQPSVKRLFIYKDESFTTHVAKIAALKGAKVAKTVSTAKRYGPENMQRNVYREGRNHA